MKLIRKNNIFAAALILGMLACAGCATDSDLTGQTEETTIVSLIKGSGKNKKASVEDIESDSGVLDNEKNDTDSSEAEAVDKKAEKAAAKAAAKEAKAAAKAEKAAAKKYAKQKKETEKALKKARKEGSDIPEVTLAQDSERVDAEGNLKVAASEVGENGEDSKASVEWFLDSANRTVLEKNVGKIKIHVNGKNGTFNFSIFDRDSKELPMFSKIEEGTNTSFFLLYGKKMYKLSGVPSVKTAARLTEYGADISYIIPGKAQVIVSFEVISSSIKRENDLIKISSVIKNLAAEPEKKEGEEEEQPVKTTKMALKLLMDTSCGENTSIHFIDSNNEAITTERQIHTSSEIKWISTGNGNSTYQILLAGGDVSPFEAVTIASYDTLNKFKWESSVNPSKTFGSASSYNDSGVAFVWKNSEVEAGGERSFQTIIATAAHPDEPNGDFYIELTTPTQPRIPSTPKVKPKVEEKTTPAVTKETIPSVPARIPDVEYTDEYINKLLNRIEALESGAAEIKRDELYILNQELDMILDYLRNN